MDIEDYILDDLETLLPSDRLDVAKKKTTNQRLSHFPVVENNKLFGSISESDLSTFEEESKQISDYQHIFELFYATKEDSLIDLLTLFAVHETNCIPVLDKNKEYLGYFDLSDMLTMYAETPFLKEEGAILILEKENKSFSISEIAQIAETNNAQLLGIHISKKTEQATQITIKVNTENINEIIQSYRRYAYNVISNHKDDSYLEDLKNRSNYLQKYLSI